MIEVGTQGDREETPELGFLVPFLAREIGVRLQTMCVELELN